MPLRAANPRIESIGSEGIWVGFDIEFFDQDLFQHMSSHNFRLSVQAQGRVNDVKAVGRTSRNSEDSMKWSPKDPASHFYHVSVLLDFPINPAEAIRSLSLDLALNFWLSSAGEMVLKLRHENSRQEGHGGRSSA